MRSAYFGVRIFASRTAVARDPNSPDQWDSFRIRNIYLPIRETRRKYLRYPPRTYSGSYCQFRSILRSHNYQSTRGLASRCLHRRSWALLLVPLDQNSVLARDQTLQGWNYTTHRGRSQRKDLGDFLMTVNVEEVQLAFEMRVYSGGDGAVMVCEHLLGTDL